MEGKCQVLTISGNIEKVAVSFSQNSRSINSVRYTKGSQSKTYGTMLQGYKEWNFDDSKLLLGLQANVEDGAIRRLGFLYLDTLMRGCTLTLQNESD